MVQKSVRVGRIPAVSAFNPPFIPWEGGPSFWTRFAKADAQAWDDPAFFPISVFFSKASTAHVASLKDAGINLYMAVEHNPGIEPLTNITSQGLYAMPHVGEWTPSEVGTNAKAVAWFISDEADMGIAYDFSLGEAGWLAAQEAASATARGYNDGRFLHSNFGNGILRTYWSNGATGGVTYMHKQVRLMDSASADKYTYTSPDVAGITTDSPDWPSGAPVPRAYSYGWQADQMRRFQDPADLNPVWTFVETAKPYLTESGSRAILPDEMEGAVWSALIHEARGVAYFQHNNDGRGNYSIVEISGVHAKVKAVNEKILSLAPVLNTQSRYNGTRVVNGFTYYRWSFSNGTDTMLKVYGGYVYIFAGLGFGYTTGTKTFTIPSGITGTSVEVVSESRSISVVGGAFSDSFPNEYTHHVYKIAL